MMHITHHKIRVKEPTTKLPKHLDKETFMNAVNRGDIPIKIPNISNAPEEYLCNFNGIANYCNFRNNQSYKNPDLFTWTLKQQQFNPYAIPKEFQNRNKKIGATPRKITSDSKLKEEIEKPLVLLNIENKNNNILNPPKRVQVYNAHRFSEKEVKKMEKEEADYEEKIRALIKTKWNDIVRNSNRLKHRKIFSITKMQNDALYDDKNSSFMDTVMVESSGMSQFSQKNHFLNPFDKKNFGINKIIHYIKAKNENNDLKDLFEPMNPKKINVVKQKFLKEKFFLIYHKKKKHFVNLEK